MARVKPDNTPAFFPGAREIYQSTHTWEQGTAVGQAKPVNAWQQCVAHELRLCSACLEYMCARACAWSICVRVRVPGVYVCPRVFGVYVCPRKLERRGGGRAREKGAGGSWRKGN